MGKTFKYGYSGNSFRSLDRHAEQKVGDRRKIRRALNDLTRAEINDIDYTICKKFNPQIYSNQKYPRTFRPNATASWNKLNANIEWKEQDGNLVGETDESVTTIVSHSYAMSTNNYSYNISLYGHFLKDNDRIGKKQLKRRNEIGKASLINRNNDDKN
jgi:hypothetical protein